MLRFIFQLEWPATLLPRFADDPVDAALAARILQIGDELAAGKPLQYIIGKAWFADTVYEVGTGVLIPRPETEELYAWIKADYAALPPPMKIADIGTGSGCLAVSLAGSFPDAEVWAVDLSPAALAYTSRNAKRILGASHRLHTLQLDFLDPALPFPVADLIVSNPPYIAENEIDAVDPHVQAHEPHLALYAPGSDALIFYRRLAAMLDGQRQARLYCEINPNYAEASVALFESLPGVEVVLRKDLTGKQRMIRCIKKAP